MESRDGVVEKSGRSWNEVRGRERISRKGESGERVVGEGGRSLESCGSK